jgi:phenylacetate-coenzyme A ligase PaaK-like adenylate-forming protein
LDISGTVFRVGGEPYTSAKAEAIERSGSRAISYYGAVETGSIGMGCGEPSQLDDVHLLTDKLGIIQRERSVADGAARVGALVFTTLLPTAPRLLLNVESDDYGVLEERECGCLFGRLGFTRHLHGIHSYDKLTSGGMTFVGSDLVALLDEAMPARFGGAPADYQLVEEEEQGIPRISIVVSPRVGEVDEIEVIDMVLAALAAGPAYKRMMASVWQGGNTLKVVRRNPHATATAKILPLHVLKRRE